MNGKEFLEENYFGLTLDLSQYDLVEVRNALDEYAEYVLQIAAEKAKIQANVGQ